MDSKPKIKNKLSYFIDSKQNTGMKFKPDREFYKKIGINHKRFGLLQRNEASATLDEIAALSDFFDCGFFELIEL